MSEIKTTALESPELIKADLEKSRNDSKFVMNPMFMNNQFEIENDSSH